MKRGVLLLLPLSLLGFACYAQNKTETLGPEPLNPQEITFDFGQVKEPGVARHTFVLKNEFHKELNIIDVTTSCGCTGSQVAKKKLAPGQSSDIEVTFDSKGYAGKVKQFVYLFTDNFGEPSAPGRPEAKHTAPQQVSLRVDGKPIRGLDNAILRIIIKAEVVK